MRASIRKKALAAAHALYRRLPRPLWEFYRALRKLYARRRLEQQVRQSSHRRVVIGANRKYQAGWIPTELYTLDVRNPEDWQTYFQPDSVDTLVAEHVWEHLTPEDGVTAARLCKIYLKPGGHLRVAVPDGCFPDPGYIEWVKPGGTGPSAYDHKVLFTHRTLVQAFEDAGFETYLLEHYDEEGVFHSTDWDPEDGLIVRSMKFHKGRTFGGHPYTSLILDARKPA